MPNRLAKEPSPYLRQHADNPVDWWAWGPEAFAEAKRRDVPIFLSIGYATCHWCHVMAHESFEDPAVGALMNAAFVNIKVDREERPDVDDVYMAVCQMMTGSGGWPLTVVLTPERKPFFAGTYIPKTARFGRTGMTDLVPAIQKAWSAKREDLVAQANHIVSHLRGEAHDFEGEHHAAEHDAAERDADEPTAAEPSGVATAPAFRRTTAPQAELDDAVLRAASAALATRFDPQHAGFGRAPKFPSAHNLLLLLRLHRRNLAPDGLRMVEATLDAMAAGGIRDHLGGGFHRYSTDPAWLLPHFEKMLYDQAMLALAYTEAFEATGHTRHRDVARSILDYVLRDLQDPAGGFRSAEDADSEGVEGKFYVWRRKAVVDILGKEDGELFCAAYGVSAEGNFHDEATKRLTGDNILHIPRPLGEVAKARGVAPTVLEARLAASRATLLRARQARVRPLLDDKVLTDWNGLAIAAFARAGRAFAEPRYTAAAVGAGRFLLTAMREPSGRLRHRFHAGTTDAHSFIDDHAFLLWGLLELYDATQEPTTLAQAVAVAHQARARFAHPGGGFYSTAADGEALLVRRREAYDGALPSGNSVMVHALVRLARLTGDAAWDELAAATVSAFAAELRSTPHGFGMMLVGLDAALAGSRETFISAGPGQRELLAVARTGYRPADVLLSAAPGLDAVAPWTRELHPADGRSAAYVCTDHACQRPVTDPPSLARLLTA